MKDAANEEQVKDCAFLGRFVGNSVLAGEAGLEQARRDARARAKNVAGVTHVVLDSESPMPDATWVAYKAYACPAQK